MALRLLFLCFLGMPLWAGIGTPKMVNTKHFSFYFIGLDPQIIVNYGALCEAFLDQVAGEWQVIFPEVRHKVTINRDYIGGIQFQNGVDAFYDEGKFAINLHFQRNHHLEAPALTPNVKSAIVVSLLRLNQDQRLPPFMERAVALYFGGGPEAYQVLDATFGFLRVESVTSYFMNSANFQGDIPNYADQLALLFGQWLWQVHEAETRSLLQAFLSGSSFSGAYEASSLGSLPDLIDLYAAEVRAQHGLVQLFLARDIWAMLAMLVFLVLFYRFVWRCFCEARMFVEPSLATEAGPLVDPEHFAGPAFGDDMQDSQVLPATARDQPQPSASEHVPYVDLGAPSPVSKAATHEPATRIPAVPPGLPSALPPDLDEESLLPPDVTQAPILSMVVPQPEAKPTPAKGTKPKSAEATQPKQHDPVSKKASQDDGLVQLDSQKENLDEELDDIFDQWQ